MKKKFLFLALIIFLQHVNAQQQSKNSSYRKPLQVVDLVSEEILPAEWQTLPVFFSLKIYAPTPMAQEGGICAAASTAYAARSIAWNINHNQTDSIDKNLNAFDPYMVYDLISLENKFDSIRNGGAYIVSALDFLKNEGCFPNNQYDSLYKIGYDSLRDYFQSFTISGYQEILFFNHYQNNYSDTTRWNKVTADFENNYKKMGFVSGEERSIGGIKKNLMDGNPVVFSASVGDNFKILNATNYIWDDNNKYDSLNYTDFHGMTIIGWNDTLFGGAFEVMNSHGQAFGDSGFFWITYRQFLSHVFEAYTVFDFNIDNGRYLSYFSNGNLKLQGEVINNKKCGIWTSYYQNGVIRSEIEYRDGWRHGAAKVYSTNGIVLTECVYNRGKLNGELIVRNEMNKVIKTGTFVMGKGSVEIFQNNYSCSGKEFFGYAESEWNFKYKNRIIGTGTFSGGYKNGTFNYYSEKGLPLISNYFQYDELKSIKDYYPNGKPKISADLTNGMIDGSKKLYDENGVLQVASYYRNNQWVEDYYLANPKIQNLNK